MWRWPHENDGEEGAEEFLPSPPGLMTALMGVDRSARIGFEVRSEIQLAHGGPAVWAMATFRP